MAEGVNLDTVRAPGERKTKWDVLEVLYFISEVYANFGSYSDFYMIFLNNKLICELNYLQKKTKKNVSCWS